jgi:hypothetical protein
VLRQAWLGNVGVQNFEPLLELLILLVFIAE